MSNSLNSEYPKFFDKSVINIKRFLSADDLATYLHISKRTVYGWVHKGILHPIRIGPRLVRFDREQIDLWIAAQQKEPTKNHGNN